MARLPIPYGDFLNDPDPANSLPIRTAWQRADDNFTDLYALQSQTVNAGDVRFAGEATTEAKITAAIAQAVIELADAVFVPASMLPYDAGLVTFNTSIRMIREGGEVTVHDVKAYGAAGDGVTDDVLAFRAASEAAGLNAGDTVYVPAGTYIVSAAVHPTTTSVAAAIVLRDNVILKGAGIRTSTIKLKAAFSEPAGMGASWQLHIISTRIPFASSLPANQGITVEDLTIDGNGANQTLIPPNSNGSGAIALFIGATKGAWINRVQVKNLFGNASSGSGETFAFDCNTSANVFYTDCEAYGDDGETATGFSVNVSTGVQYSNCIAYGMTHGMGFTHWTSAAVQYVNCRAYLNGRHGFNTERSEYVTYTNCHSGGRAAIYASNPFFTSGEVLGNTDSGFKVLGSKYVSYVGCVGSRNTGRGLWIASATSPAQNSDTVIIDDCMFDTNGAGGLDVATGSLRVFVAASVKSISNTSFDFNLTAGTGTKYDIPTVFLSALEFEPVFGTPAITTLPTGGRRKVYAFDAAASETIQAWVVLPMGEASWSVQFFWCNLGAGAGVVVWQVAWLEFADNDNISPNESVSMSGNFTAPTQELLEITTFSGSTIPSTGKLMGIRVQRTGGSGSDTLANDAGFAGLLLTPVMTT